MSIKIDVKRNHFSTTDKPYYPHVERSDVLEYEQFVDDMASGRTTLTKPDIIATNELFKEELAKLLEDGKAVKTPIGTFFITAKGLLDSLDQSFTPSDQNSGHQICVHYKPDPDFLTEIRNNVKIVRTEHIDKTCPSLSSAVSVRTSEDMKAKPSDFIRIAGLRLKFDKTVEATGVFFVNGKETRAAQYASITPTLVIAEVPPGLESGPYALVVRSLPVGCKDVKEGRAQAPFVVA